MVEPHLRVQIGEVSAIPPIHDPKGKVARYDFMIKELEAKKSGETSPQARKQITQRQATVRKRRYNRIRYLKKKWEQQESLEKASNTVRFVVDELDTQKRDCSKIAIAQFAVDQGAKHINDRFVQAPLEWLLATMPPVKRHALQKGLDEKNANLLMHFGKMGDPQYVAKVCAEKGEVCQNLYSAVKNNQYAQSVACGLTNNEALLEAAQCSDALPKEVSLQNVIKADEGTTYLAPFAKVADVCFSALKVAAAGYKTKQLYDLYTKKEALVTNMTIVSDLVVGGANIFMGAKAMSPLQVYTGAVQLGVAGVAVQKKRLHTLFANKVCEWRDSFVDAIDEKISNLLIPNQSI